MYLKLKAVSKNYVSCVFLHNTHKVLDPGEMQKEILQGRYDFMFPLVATEFKQKFEKSTLEPMCFYMYKRGDLMNKIDKVDNTQVIAAKRFYKVL